jgi:hypothetical protein
MKQKILFSLASLMLACCTSSGDSSSEKIVGAYTIETTFQVPEGIAKVRDTIFINKKQNGFEITNKKWRSNNYDMDGWKNLRPGANDGALYPYQVTYDPTDHSLNSDPPGMMPTLYLDMHTGQLFKGKTRNRAYVKL